MILREASKSEYTSPSNADWVQNSAEHVESKVSEITNKNITVCELYITCH